MTAKLYIAGYPVLISGADTYAEHAYILYDADGDLNTKDDQRIIRGWHWMNFPSANKVVLFKRKINP